MHTKISHISINTSTSTRQHLRFFSVRLLVSTCVCVCFQCMYVCVCWCVCMCFCVYFVSFLCAQSSQVGKAVLSDCHMVLLLAALVCGFPLSTNVDLVLLVLTSNLKRILYKKGCRRMQSIACLIINDFSN